MASNRLLSNISLAQRNSMSGPIVRTGTTPEFWKNWDRIFGDKKQAGDGTTAGKKSAKKAATKAGTKSAKMKSAKKGAKKASGKGK